MICSKCGKECFAVTEARSANVLYSDSIAVSNCCGARVNMTEIPRIVDAMNREKILMDIELGKKENNMDWKDLEIGNIPSDFFVNDRYEVELKNGKHSKKGVPIPFESTVYSRVEIIENLLNGTFLFRYRLKPLEPIRITRKMWKAYCNYMGYNVANLFDDGRPVEIIEE